MWETRQESRTCPGRSPGGTAVPSSRAVRTRHQERPDGQIPAVDAHSAIPRVPVTDQLPDAESEENECDNPLQQRRWQNLPGQYPHQNRHDDGERVAVGQREKRPPHGRRAFLLKAQGDRKEPAHAGVDAVPGPEEQQRRPGPQRSRGHGLRRSSTSRTTRRRPGAGPGGAGTRPRTRPGSSGRG